MTCQVCNKRSYSDYCVQHKPRKPIQTRTVPKRSTALPSPKRRIKQMGRRSIELSVWVKEVARPYLITTYGEVCNVRYCGAKEALDVDHILNKGSRPDLKMVLTNVQLLCRQHHRQKTDGGILEYKN